MIYSLLLFYLFILLIILFIISFIYYLAISINCGKNIASVGVTPRTKQLGVTPHTPLFEGKKPENQKTIITIRKGRLLLVNDQGFSQIAPT